jgi:TnsA endonuclease N terminal
MSKFAQGVYQPKNPNKYVGKGLPRYRSGWEWSFFRFCDENDHVLQWASEAISIPYRNPVTGKNSMYVPDIFMTYRTKNNRVCAEVIEIKPRKQSLIEGRMTDRDRAVVAVNHAKWDQAVKWCQRAGLVFRVINETDMFHQGSAKKRK